MIDFYMFYYRNLSPHPFYYKTSISPHPDPFLSKFNRKTDFLTPFLPPLPPVLVLIGPKGGPSPPPRVSIMVYIT